MGVYSPLCIRAYIWTPAALSTSATLGWSQGMGSYMALDGVLNGLKWGCIHLCICAPTMIMMLISLFGPVGCGRPLRGARHPNIQPHTALHIGFLAIHFVKVKWYLCVCAYTWTPAAWSTSATLGCSPGMGSAYAYRRAAPSSTNVPPSRRTPGQLAIDQ
jgi:hypothetical protein